MMELDIKELKKALACILCGCVLLLYMLLMGSLSGIGASGKSISTISGILSTEEGQKIYTTIWKPVLDKIQKEHELVLSASWFMAISMYLEDPYVLQGDRAESIAMLAIEQQEETWKPVELEEFLKKVTKEPGFADLDEEEVKDWILSDTSADVIYNGNVPKSLEEIKKLKLHLPVDDWSAIYDVGMYDPFGTGYRMHYGMDISVPVGTKLYAVAPSRVVFKGVDEISGHVVILQNGVLYMLYCHMKQPALVEVGQSVTSGQLIGYSGATGNVTGAHLHFQTCSVPGESSYVDCYNLDQTAKYFFNPKLVWDFKK